MKKENSDSSNTIDILPLLAIETSEKLCGVSLLLNKNEYYSAKIFLPHSHSEKLFELIEILRDSSSIKLNEIKSLAVSSGPGSFTGLRIGMAAAKGIAAGLNVPIIPVPTFEALAYQLSKILPEEQKFIIANKANRDEAYFAKFHIKNNNYIFEEQLKILPISEIKISESELLFGNILTNSKKLISPEPEFVGFWAIEFGENKLIRDFDFLEPNYIKDFIVKEVKK
ncbi:MAG: tRNA (adenosine(37)-N6)-threonylcarbamoyltransferase complex dimerization subunit type 1 TsaB [Ignavibacterium sp.]|uniref:tRNA (adenosine(37)-N6)-threonylcarbamoyltransferase complex dimerization subunit type 1 TsaB n=1 Tax=Ignavibacterium sp. TaxID=2651167 RepID=UPI00404A0767